MRIVSLIRRKLPHLLGSAILRACLLPFAIRSHHSSPLPTPSLPQHAEALDRCAALQARQERDLAALAAAQDASLRAADQAAEAQVERARGEAAAARAREVAATEAHASALANAAAEAAAEVAQARAAAQAEISAALVSWRRLGGAILVGKGR